MLLTPPAFSEHHKYLSFSKCIMLMTSQGDGLTLYSQFLNPRRNCVFFKKIASNVSGEKMIQVPRTPNYCNIYINNITSKNSFAAAKNIVPVLFRRRTSPQKLTASLKYSLDACHPNISYTAKAKGRRQQPIRYPNKTCMRHRPQSMPHTN